MQDILSAYPDEIRKKITKKELVFVTTNYGKFNSFQQYTTAHGDTYKAEFKNLDSMLQNIIKSANNNIFL